MRLRIQKWNFGEALAIMALLFSLKSLLDLSSLSGSPILPNCVQDYGGSFFSLASFFGFVLGYWALKKVTKVWLNLLAARRSDTGHRYEWIAVLAMSLAMPAMTLTISNLTELSFRYRIHPGRETAAIQTLRSIHNNQAQYQAMKGHFGTLKDLNNVGLIEEIYASGRTISGYQYSSSDITTDTYCVRAYRTNPTCHSRDFIVCEDGEIHYVDTPVVTILKRGEGKSLTPPDPQHQL